MASETKYSLPRVMTVKELSEYLRVHPSTIYKLLRRGELPGFRIGTDWRFNAEVIDRWCLERNMKAPGAGTPSNNGPARSSSRARPAAARTQMRSSSRPAQSRASIEARFF